MEKYRSSSIVIKGCLPWDFKFLPGINFHGIKITGFGWDGLGFQKWAEWYPGSQLQVHGFKPWGYRSY